MRTELSCVSISCAGVLIALTTLPSMAEDLEPNAVALLRATPFAHKAYGINVVKGRAELISEDRRATNKTKVIVRLSGLKPGSKHVGRIHGGTCSNVTPAITVYKLEPVIADHTGEGVSRTQVPEGLPGVADCEWWITFHEGSDPKSPKSPIALGPVISPERSQRVASSKVVAAQ